MKIERQKQIKKEAKRRIDLWLSVTSFDEMTVYGSYVRFNMAIGLLGGYPFAKEKWMLENDFGSFISAKEFDTVEYDEILSGLFREAMSN